MEGKTVSKQTKTLILCGLLTVMISIATSINSEKEIATSSKLGLNNQKIEWGIQRKENHEQPDLGAKNKELIKKYNGIAIGSPEKKYIYLTFDLGYEAGYTEKILDALKMNNVQGAFFVTAHYVNTAPDLIKRMIDDGHIIRKPYC